MEHHIVIYIQWRYQFSYLKAGLCFPYKHLRLVFYLSDENVKSNFTLWKKQRQRVKQIYLYIYILL